MNKPTMDKWLGAMLGACVGALYFASLMVMGEVAFILWLCVGAGSTAGWMIVREADDEQRIGI